MTTVTQAPSTGNAAAVVASAQLVGAISMNALALVLGAFDPKGKPRGRAAKEWCRRHGVATRPDGKHRFADLADVLRAFSGLPTEQDRDARRDRVADLLARRVSEGPGRRG